MLGTPATDSRDVFLMAAIVVVILAATALWLGIGRDETRRTAQRGADLLGSAREAIRRQVERLRERIRRALHHDHARAPDPEPPARLS